MEILIIGGALVALMVYASTRIKKSAARAYEAETIETEEFSLVKPEGMINPINGGSGLAFEAYSKEFGATDATEKLYRAQATLRIGAEDFADYCRRAKNDCDRVLSEETESARLGRQKVYLLKGEKNEADAATIVYRKIVGAEQRVYDLQATVLNESVEAFGEKIEEMVESFRVK